jgi:hypothetical protein
MPKSGEKGITKSLEIEVIKIQVRTGRVLRIINNVIVVILVWLYMQYDKY